MRLFEKIFGKKLNNKGVSLVELVCAIGILSLVATAAAGVMIVGSRTYSRGTVEVAVQQEAEIAANQISNYIINASEEPTITLNGADVELDVLVDGVNYQIKFDSASNTLFLEDQILAEYVSEFWVDLSNYGTTKTGDVRIAVEQGNARFETLNGATSRNGQESGISEGGSATIVIAPKIVLEPNQSYTFSASVMGSSNQNVSYILGGNTDTATTLIGNLLTIGKNELASELTVVVNTQATGEDGVTPLGTATVTVYIRRVTGIEVTGSLLSGTSMRAGAKYRVTAKPTGTNLDKKPTLESDYITPKDVAWNTLYTIGGEALGTGSQIGVLPSSYYSVTSTHAATADDETSYPYMEFTLNQDMLQTHVFQVTATAVHPEGTLSDGTTKSNKSGLPYVGNPSDATFLRSHVFGTYDLYSGYYSYDGSRLNRGSDQEQGRFTMLDALKTQMRIYYGYNANWQGRMFHRYREVYYVNEAGQNVCGPWTSWRANPGDSNDSYALNLRPLATESFDSTKTYELQMRLEIYDATHRVVAWPFDDTPASQYIIDDIIEPVVLHFDLRDNSWNLVQTEKSTLGTPDAPYLINKNAQYTLSLDTYLGIAQNTGIKDKIYYVLEKKNGSSWDYISTYHNGDQPYRFSFSDSNVYRVRITTKDVPFSYYSTEFGSPQYVLTTRDYDFSNEETGKGIFYFKAQ